MNLKLTSYCPLLSDFLWIYRTIRRTDSFIVNCADLEYTKKSDQSCIWISQLDRQITLIVTECIRIIIHFWLVYYY